MDNQSIKTSESTKSYLGIIYDFRKMSTYEKNIDTITDNKNIKKLLLSDSDTDRILGLYLLDRDPETDEQFKFFLWVGGISSGVVDQAYLVDYSDLSDSPYNNFSTVERCKLWKIKKK